MHSTRITICVTVGRPSVCPSVCPVDRQQQRRAAGLLLSTPLAGNIDRQLRMRCGRRAADTGAQQQRRRSK